jgi:tRNA-Thr(GGU) m(6)t(6)A37 methyltransferase TsaA
MSDQTRKQSFTFKPIGIVRSCFTEKFGIPRQPGLIPDAEAVVEILAPWNRAEAWQELGAFSHVWLIFVFHAVPEDHDRLTARPPRLGGNKRVGVFATRSPFRPNPVGLSVVRLDSVDISEQGVALRVRGADILDGTPVLDVKPYLPYVDSVPDAAGDYAGTTPEPRLTVSFTPEAEAACEALRHRYPQLQALVRQMLELDPRPAYSGTKSIKNTYGMRLYDLEVKWAVDGGKALVTQIQAATSA